MDHDFHYANIIPSVALRCHIPAEVSGSFFIGGDDGIGQIFVTLRDATFDPSEVFDHCAQLIDCLRRKDLNPNVLVLQTDGGPDHSLKRVATKFALIATFKELNIDHLVVLRGAPNGSARNKVERSMSILNLPLAHMAIKREKMHQWAEDDLKKASSMKQVREAGKKVEERRKKAIASVEQLEENYNSFVIAETSEYHVCTCSRYFLLFTCILTTRLHLQKLSPLYQRCLRRAIFQLSKCLQLLLLRVCYFSSILVLVHQRDQVT